jgi:hypothetical protein
MTSDLDVRACDCEPDLDSNHYARQCDYCATTSAATSCIHDAYQPPCPECDVVPLVQLP